MTEGMGRRLHMGCGEPLVGIYPLRDKASVMTRQTGTAIKPPNRSGKSGDKPT
ncbi:hypothetical protein [Sedimenticola thiotaurini]|uniref:hypothetical protein n=1 Tax=Sedimenticola thiotaurini TaxID=1543721 RepID=UPI001900590C|nr:hypothetical protein [Sedimenticola thiotaurini]